MLSLKLYIDPVDSIKPVKDKNIEEKLKRISFFFLFLYIMIQHIFFNLFLIKSNGKFLKQILFINS